MIFPLGNTGPSLEAVLREAGVYVCCLVAKLSPRQFGRLVLMVVKVKVAQSCVQLFATLWNIQSMEFSRQEHWSG